MNTLQKTLAIGLFGLASSVNAAIVDLNAAPQFTSFINGITTTFIGPENFTSEYNADINDQNNINISTSSVHATINGIGSDQVDYYSFVGQQGSLVLDIDYGMNVGGSFDPWIELYDFNFDRIAFDDDFDIGNNHIDSGSSHGWDSFLQTTLSADSLYYIGVGQWPSLGAITTGGTYSLQIAQPVPEPSTIALMLGGLGLVGFMANRRRKEA